MEERYLRNLGALEERECEALRSKKVFVAGCGGLGGYIIELLLRLGVGSITAMDGDAFEESNLNRQLLADALSLGRSKAEAAAQRAARVNPQVSFKVMDEYLDAGNAADAVRGHDVVIDALDSVGARILLSRACESALVPLIHGAVSGWNAQIGVSMPGDGLIEKLYGKASESPLNCLSFTPALCASVQAAECVKLLCSRESALRGRLMCVDLLSGEWEIVAL